ncbi:MAG TPA: wax ester/triacylglycerol synthase family O-acyltransferase [Roseiarcus sp.]|nr:wax ester/triacylglycerol synthase family O-acyltransferase [Roseiarcus sp.]
MNRLSALDALFLYMETPQTPMQVGSVTIFKPASPQDDLFARFRDHTAGRLDLLPSYRRRLESTPLGIDHPAWVIDDKLDLDYHIRRTALPKPGTMAQLRELVAQLHAVPLDHSRPLWEYYFIEGLEGDAFAIYIKVHHSAMDGIAGMATLGVTYDFAPEAEHESAPHRIVPPDAEPSDFIELTSTAVGDFVRQGWRAVKSLPGAARALTKAAPHFARDASFLYRYVKDMPRTPFNKAISAHRVYATCSLPLPEVKALAKSSRATINDIVLALSAGGVRRYLIEHSALPDKPLTAGVPASLRAFGDAKLNNQVMFTLSRLPTDVAEPLPRLTASQAAAQEAKNLFADMRDFLTTDISILGAPLVVMGLTRLWAGARAANYLWPFFNVVISNVPGPRQTMYCVGAPATHYFPVSIPYHGCALNITVQSYLDQLDFGLIACSETVPDAQRIADFIVEDFAAMRKADADLNRPEAIETIAVAMKDASVAAHRPIQLAEPKIEAPAPKAEKASALTRDIEELSAATEALLRKVKQKRSPAARAKPPPLKPNVAKAGKRATSKARPTERASEEASAPPSLKPTRKGRARRQSRAPARAGE